MSIEHIRNEASAIRRELASANALAYELYLTVDNYDIITELSLQYSHLWARLRKITMAQSRCNDLVFEDLEDGSYLNDELRLANHGTLIALSALAREIELPSNPTPTLHAVIIGAAHLNFPPPDPASDPASDPIDPPSDAPPPSA